MSSIDNYLQAIQTAIYGGEVRNAIHDSIQECYLNVVDLKTSVANIIDTDITLNNWVSGKYYNTPSTVTNILITDLTNNGSMSCQYVACSSGDIFLLTGAGASGGKLWVWIKSNGDIISRAASNATGTDLELIAPENAAYLLVNVHTEQTHSLRRDVRQSLKVPIEFSTVSDMQASTDLQIGMKVRTLGYNTETDGLGCVYKISADASEYEYTGRVHIGSGSLYAIPLLEISTNNNKPNGPVTDLVRLAETYQQSGKSWYMASGLSVADYPGAFDDNYASDTYNMRCNILSRLMLYGIDFASSKYGGGTNTHKQGYWPDIDTRFSFSSSPAGSAAEQALYCAYKGWAYYPNSDYSNIRPGDLCFFSFSTDENDAVYKSIDHVAIYLGRGHKTSNNATVHHFIGNDGNASNRNITTLFYAGNDAYLSKIVLCAGFSKMESSDRPENIVVDSYTAIKTSGQGVYTYEMVKPFKSQSAYTIVFDASGVPSSYTLAVGADQNYMLTDDCVTSLNIIPTSTHVVLHLFTPDISSLTEAQKKQLRLYRGTASGPSSLTVSEFRVYDGWI